MDLNFSADETAFRDEVRSWLRANLPQDLRDKVENYAHLSKDDLLRWHKILAKKGWVAPAWPKEWGGTGDLYLPADDSYFDLARDKELIDEIIPLALVRPVLAVKKGNPKGIRGLSDLGRSGLIVVLADPSVPAGKYARQALVKAGVTVKPASLELQVTAVLTKVALGEADAGIVYVSDVVTSGKVDGVTIPDDQNVIADYPIATLASARNVGLARRFVGFVLSQQGQAILSGAGFSTV